MIDEVVSDPASITDLRSKLQIGTDSGPEGFVRDCRNIDNLAVEKITFADPMGTGSYTLVIAEVTTP